MKMLRIISSMDPEKGGPCQGIRNSIPEFRKLGIETDVISLDNPVSPFLGKDTFPVKALGPAKTKWQYSAALKPWLAKHLEDYDTVIVHGLWQYHSYASVKAYQLLKKSRGGNLKTRLFVMPHGMLDPYFQKAGDRKLKAIRNFFYWMFIESFVIRNAEGVLFTCKEELLLARSTFKPYRPKQELNVGYGILPPPELDEKAMIEFNTRFPRLIHKKFILFLSRIHQKKGLDNLVNAYQSVFSENIADAPLLVIAGPGLDSAFGVSLLNKINTGPFLQEHIIFTGMISGEMKWAAFHACSCFILPSHQENFGISVVEAMACEKAVLISDQVNIWREISEAGAGLVEPDTLEGCCKLVQKWKDLPETEKYEMGKRAADVYRQKFSVEKACIQMHNLINIHA